MVGIDSVDLDDSFDDRRGCGVYGVRVSHVRQLVVEEWCFGKDV